MKTLGVSFRACHLPGTADLRAYLCLFQPQDTGLHSHKALNCDIKLTYFHEEGINISHHSMQKRVSLCFTVSQLELWHWTGSGPRSESPCLASRRWKSLLCVTAFCSPLFTKHFLKPFNKSRPLVQTKITAKQFAKEREQERLLPSQCSQFCKSKEDLGDNAHRSLENKWIHFCRMMHCLLCCQLEEQSLQV